MRQRQRSDWLNECVAYLVGLEQRLDQLERGGDRNILIHLSVCEEQLARELVRGRVVRVLGIMRADLSHPRFVPRGLVHPVVVTAGRAHCDFVDVAVVEDRPSGVIAYEYMTPRIA